ncbi:hypothetical protein QA599_12645 [Haloarculaceae archaeon H-GB1-1]|nr:hypothetical protein [Haloarculaceae archaeon H-GB1-1]
MTENRTSFEDGKIVNAMPTQRPAPDPFATTPLSSSKISYTILSFSIVMDGSPKSPGPDQPSETVCSAVGAYIQAKNVSPSCIGSPFGSVPILPLPPSVFPSRSERSPSSARLEVTVTFSSFASPVDQYDGNPPSNVETTFIGPIGSISVTLSASGIVCVVSDSD